MIFFPESLADFQSSWEEFFFSQWYIFVYENQGSFAWMGWVEAKWHLWEDVAQFSTGGLIFKNGAEGGEGTNRDLGGRCNTWP